MSHHMNRMSKRLSSFKTWPAENPINPLDLAQAGFYFTGQGDKVKCFQCHGSVMMWGQGDNPFEEHKTHFPQCPFVISRERLSESQDSSNVETNRIDTEDENINDITGDISKLEMINEQNRLNTLVSWPKRDVIDIRKVAATGMYYTGNGDKVKCAFCCGAMQNWETGDDPDEEHRKYFGKKCPFLKGEIEDIIGPVDPMQENLMDGLNIVKWKPIHPRYVSESARVASFAGSPVNVQMSQTMARAGFFFHQNGKYCTYNTQD